jgi:hypothetical protein
MLTDHDLERMYTVAQALHREPEVALTVTLAACERLELLRRLQDRRTAHQTTCRLPDAYLPQYCVYLASEACERAQEAPPPSQERRDPPTLDDWLVRYIKFLVWRTMDQDAYHVAVALGCFLYRYPPSAIARLAPAGFPAHRVPPITQRLAQQIHTRFPRAHIMMYGEHPVLDTRPPTADERQLIQQTLTLFAPWGLPEGPPPTSGLSRLDTYFGEGSTSSEWKRIQVLIDPTRGGLPGLIREYNARCPHGSDGCLEDPDQTLAIPCFQR